MLIIAEKSKREQGEYIESGQEDKLRMHYFLHMITAKWQSYFDKKLSAAYMINDLEFTPFLMNSKPYIMYAAIQFSSKYDKIYSQDL